MGDLLQRVAQAALARSVELLGEWLTGGVVRGHEFLVGDLTGSKGESLSININTGHWADFADPTLKGGDLVALYAAIHRLRQIEAAKELARRLGVEDTPPGRAPAAPTTPAGAVPAPKAPAADENGWTLCRPAPLDAPDYRSVLQHHEFGAAAAHWCYHDAAGRLLMVVVRWNVVVNGETDKQIRQFTCWRHESGTLAWRFKWIDRPRPLYREDQLAARPVAPVMVCEGEKAADRAALLFPDHVCTTSPGGAANGAHADWSKLTGRRVAIWPDADETELEFSIYCRDLPASEKPRKIDQSGSSYAKIVATKLAEAKATEILIIDTSAGAAGRVALAKQLALPDLPRGFDAADVPAGLAIDLPALLATAETPRRGVGDERRKGRVPSGEYHQALIDALVEYLDKRGLAPDALDGWRDAKSWNLVREDMASLATDFAFEFRHHDGIAMTYILETLDAHSRRRRHERRRSLILALTSRTPTPDDDAVLNAWVRAVTGAERELDIAVVRHWIWNAKRMALGLRTERDLMMVIYGPQGSGKTTAVERLVAPLAELGITVDATYLTDDRRSPVLAAAIVGRWEEMQGSQRADLEALKHTLTSLNISYRPMRTTQTVVQPRTCSFIGTSNVPIDAMVQDVTGNRRFVQLDTEVRCDWAAIKDMDAVRIWNAVDHTSPAPINPFVHLLQAHQAEHQHRDPFALWLESEKWAHLEIQRGDSAAPLVIGAYQSGSGELFEEMAARFQFWCRTVGQAPMGVKSFALRLKQEGFTDKQRREPNGSRPRYYFRPSPPPSIPTAETSQSSPAGSPPAEPPDDLPWH